MRHKFWRVGRAGLCLLGGGGPSSLKFLLGVGLGGGVKFLRYFLEGGGGVSGQPGNSSGYTLADPRETTGVKEI